MKLATYKDGSRDGQLVVVSRDLATAHYATGIASRLQQALDDWNFISPQLQDLYDALNAGRARHPFPFDAAQCMAPLPRAYQWADGSAYLNHVELVRAARGAEVPESYFTDPLMYQGGSDDFLGARDDIRVADEAFGIDFEAELDTRTWRGTWVAAIGTGDTEVMMRAFGLMAWSLSTKASSQRPSLGSSGPSPGELAALRLTPTPYGSSKASAPTAPGWRA